MAHDLPLKQFQLFNDQIVLVTGCQVACRDRGVFNMAYLNRGGRSTLDILHFLVNPLEMIQCLDLLYRSWSYRYPLIIFCGEIYTWIYGHKHLEKN